MKKLLKVLILLLVVSLINVEAANYKMKELIPIEEETTIRGDYFVYKDIKFDKNRIVFGSIKNLSNEKRSLTVSIGLFGKNKRNINIINFCTTEDALDAGEEVFNYVIDVKTDKFKDNTSISDIKYFSILSENGNCRIGGEDEFIGRRINNIFSSSSGELPKNASVLLKIVEIIGAFLLAMFLYKYIFTARFTNMDGDDIRKAYKNMNSGKKNNQNQVTKKKTSNNKDSKIIEQELKENSKSKDDSNLHNLYK